MTNAGKKLPKVSKLYFDAYILYSKRLNKMFFELLKPYIS